MALARGLFLYQCFLVVEQKLASAIDLEKLVKTTQFRVEDHVFGSALLKVEIFGDLMIIERVNGCHFDESKCHLLVR